MTLWMQMWKEVMPPVIFEEFSRDPHWQSMWMDKDIVRVEERVKDRLKGEDGQEA